MKKRPQNYSKKASKPSKMEALNHQFTLFLKPLTDYQKSIMFVGKVSEKKQSNFKKWISKNATVLDILQKATLLIIAIVLLLTKPILLFLFPISGYLTIHKTHLKFVYWYVKVFFIFRNFYQDRRVLYKQGTLLHHFKVKLPKTFNTKKGKLIIWGQSGTIQQAKFNKLSKANKLTSKEYIYT